MYILSSGYWADSWLSRAGFAISCAGLITAASLGTLLPVAGFMASFGGQSLMKRERRSAAHHRMEDVPVRDSHTANSTYDSASEQLDPNAEQHARRSAVSKRANDKAVKKTS
jgi:hypothetical protein